MGNSSDGVKGNGNLSCRCCRPGQAQGCRHGSASVLANRMAPPAHRAWGDQMEVAQTGARRVPMPPSRAIRSAPSLGHALQQHAELGTGLIQRGGGELVPVARGIEYPGGEAAMVAVMARGASSAPPRPDPA